MVSKAPNYLFVSSYRLLAIRSPSPIAIPKLLALWKERTDILVKIKRLEKRIYIYTLVEKEIKIEEI